MAGSEHRQPPFRRLRIYSLDPSLQTQLETAVINETWIAVPWEPLAKGPVGEYLEVVDYDPASDYFYAPVDLDHPHLLAQDGLPPSEGNPQFHQQMVYAVAMRTIQNFKKALGRPVLWGQRRYRENGRERIAHVPRLRIYPHALREANAYYSPAKKALLFGYFPADASDPGGHLPGGMVFSCLSHDIVAHETTHALLDGIHRRFIEPSNPDVLAFHEAFADLVALFQHFSMHEVLTHQLALTRGELRAHSLLGQLAKQFGRATGGRGALRDAIGRYDEEKNEWSPHEPQPGEYARTLEPHARGAILVAAIFDAFVAIYERRSEDLVRIASGGTGILPDGRLHPDLIGRLAREAAKTAGHFLTLCIRALDYCPPFDITFGEYLRAMITADRDLVPDDPYGYRVALIEAFRRRGIYPLGVRTLSEESLAWRTPTAKQQAAFGFLEPYLDRLKSSFSEWDLEDDRERLWEHGRKQRAALERMIRSRTRARSKGAREAVEAAYHQLGLSTRIGKGRFEVHSVRPARRTGPDGQHILELVVELTQQRPIFFQPDGTVEMPKQWSAARGRRADSWFRGGCTLLIDVGSRSVRYCIYKRIDGERRPDRQVEFQRDAIARSLRATYLGDRGLDEAEPFALLHRNGGDEYEDG